MRTLVSLAALSLCFASCQKTIQESREQASLSGKSVIRKCGSAELLRQELASNPSLEKRMQDIEAQTQRFVEKSSAAALSSAPLELKVHVNVLYSGPADFISDEQIQSQIDVLNEDFAATNRDLRKLPGIFTGIQAGNTGIHFNWTPANTTRRLSTKTEFSYNSADMKKDNTGGISPTNPETTLNIWVCNIDAGILGFATFPGGNSRTDGVVIDNNAFGRGRKFNLYAEYNLGRTATHEVGHYFNLYHIWGDRACGTDQVDDTPQHYTYNFGCPAFPQYSLCNSSVVEMTMNYMDYTDDACLYAFTHGQALRMQATYAAGGPRAGLML